MPFAFPRKGEGGMAELLNFFIHYEQDESFRMHGHPGFDCHIGQLQ